MRVSFALALAGAAVAVQAADEAKVTVTLPPGSDALGSPSSALKLSFMHHKTTAWGDLRGAEFRNPHPLITQLPTTVPASTVPKGTLVEFDCPANGGYEVCDAWVFFYHCPQSCTTKYQGGVPQQLAADGWQFTLCAPHFVTGVASGFVHHMRSYRMKVQPGEVVSFTTNEDAEFLAFGIDAEGVDCSALADETACNLRGKALRCKWDAQDGVCRDNTCRIRSKGPPPPCDECPWKDLANRPVEDGPFGGVIPLR